MKIGIRVPQVVSIFKELQQNPEQIFRMARLDVREMVGRYLSKMIGAGLTHFLGRGPYERKDAGEAEPGAGNHRNGPYHRSFTLKGIGELSTMVPRDGNGQYHTQILPRSRQDEGAIAHDLCLLFPEGVSTRAPALMTERLVGRKISHTELNRTNGELKEAVEKWRNRELSQGPVKDLFVDGVNFRMRMGDPIERVPVLVVIGVTGQGCRFVLGLQAGDKESAPLGESFSKISKEEVLMLPRSPWG